MRAWHGLQMVVGVCIANPIPAADEIPASEIDAVIAEALDELAAQGIVGQAVTPFLLSRIVDQDRGPQPEGQHVTGQAERRTGGDIAVEYSRP